MGRRKDEMSRRRDIAQKKSRASDVNPLRLDVETNLGRASRGASHGPVDRLALAPLRRYDISVSLVCHSQ